MPTEFETTEFLEACVTMLRPEGMILINRLSRSNSDKVRSERYYENVFQKSLHGAWIIDTDGNMILCWKK
jgi:2-polyprenyl-3-methyl-5-hydroxy-6-metoxy-1,4-benzoquinol methylase